MILVVLVLVDAELSFSFQSISFGWNRSLDFPEDNFRRTRTKPVPRKGVRCHTPTKKGGSSSDWPRRP